MSAQLEADYGIVPDIVPGHNAETDAFYADLVAIFQVSSTRRGTWLSQRRREKRQPDSHRLLQSWTTMGHRRLAAAETR